MEVPGLFCAPFCLLCLLCSLLYCSLSSFVLLAPSVAVCRLSFVLLAPSVAACLLSFVLLALSGLPAYSLLCSSLSPALSAYSLKLLLALPGWAPPPPCMSRHACTPPDFPHFRLPSVTPPVTPARDTRPRHPAAALSHRARVPILAPPCPCPCVLFFSRFSARNVVYLIF